MLQTYKEGRAQAILHRFKELETEKQPWLPTWQLIGEYVMTRKQNFNSQVTQGEFLTGQIFDSTAANANHLMASSLIGALWPNGARTFKILPPDGMPLEVSGTDEVKQFYERVTNKMVAAIDNAKSGFLTSLEEYMLDQGAFGISGMSALENDNPEEYDIPVKFNAIDAKKMAIDEGPDGFVDTVYIKREMTVKQIVQEYKIENVSEKVRERFKNGGLEEKVHVLHAIEPRIDGVPGSFGSKDFPVASIHIEIESCHILKESGFKEMPVFVTRFWKAMNEKYGRSPAMEAMSDIMEANNLREALIIATEKQLDPPLVVDDDGSLGAKRVNTSAGAINVRRISGRMGDAGREPIRPLYTVGELKSTMERIAELREIIFNAFFIDRLLDLNNETRMTLGEAQIRNELRGQSLGTIYARQLAELFTPLVERAFNIMLERGFFGVVRGGLEDWVAQQMGQIPEYIPDEIANIMLKGQDAFKVVFISPAARIMRSEELMGIQRTIQFALESAQAAPEILDNIDFDEVIRAIQDLTGAPSNIIKSRQAVFDIREARAQQQQQMLAMQAQQAQAEAVKTGADAMKSAANAGLSVSQMGMAA